MLIMMITHVGTIGSILCKKNKWLSQAKLRQTGDSSKYVVEAPSPDDTLLSPAGSAGIELKLIKKLGGGAFGSVYLFSHGVHEAAVKVVENTEYFEESVFTILNAPKKSESLLKQQNGAALVSIFSQIDCRVVYTQIYDVDDKFVFLMERVDYTALHLAHQLRNLSNINPDDFIFKMTEINAIAKYALNIQHCSMTGPINFAACDFKLDNIGVSSCEPGDPREYTLIDPDSLVLLVDPTTQKELQRSYYYPGAYWLEGARPDTSGNYFVSEVRLNAYFQAIIAIIEFAFFALRIQERFLPWYTLFREDGGVKSYLRKSPQDVYHQLIHTITLLKGQLQPGDSTFDRIKGRIPSKVYSQLGWFCENIKQQLTGFFTLYQDHGMIGFKKAGTNLKYLKRGRKTLPEVEARLVEFSESWRATLTFRI